MKKFIITLLPGLIIAGILYFSVNNISGKFLNKSTEIKNVSKNPLIVPPEMNTLINYQISAISSKTNTRITIISENKEISAKCVHNVKIDNESVAFQAENLADNIVLITVNKTYRAHITLEADLCGEHIKSLVTLVTI